MNKTTPITPRNAGVARGSADPPSLAGGPPESPALPCPRCAKPGRRLGARPVDGATVYHCRGCGCLWPVASRTINER